VKLLGDAWISYRERVLSPDAAPVQVQETRRAFYVGAQALWDGIMRNLDPGTEPTDRDMSRMDGLEAELREFVENVEAGLA
jgi:hypothetical protein